MAILQWTNTTSVISRGGTFSLFLSLVILLLVFPSNLVVSGVNNPKLYPSLISNVTLFSILFIYICTDGLSVFSPCFFKIYSKYSWIFDTDYNQSGKSKLSFHVGADIINLLLLYELFMLFQV